jgi:hypothetical protein
MSMTETQSHEFPVTLGDERGFGTLLVTDLALMVRPAPAGQYHARSPHDAARIAEIMNLTADEAHRLMDKAWWAYFDGFCMGKTWIDAAIRYIGAGGEILHRQGYGFTDGHATGVVYVYTKEFWDGDQAISDWVPLLKQTHLMDENDSSEPIKLDQLENTFRAGLRNIWGGKMVLVQPSSKNESGYTAQGFELVYRDE